jgi:hypothetical protein
MNVQQGTGDQGGQMMQKYGRSQGFYTLLLTIPSTMYGNDLVQVDEQDYRHKDVSWMEMEDLIYDNPSHYSMVHSLLLIIYGQTLRLYPYDGTLLCEDTIRCWYGYPRFKMYALNQEQRPDRQDGGKMDMYIYRVAEKHTFIRAEARLWQDKIAGASGGHQRPFESVRTPSTGTHVADVQNEGIGASARRAQQGIVRRGVSTR